MYVLDIFHNREGIVGKRVFPELPRVGDILRFMCRGEQSEYVVSAVAWTDDKDMPAGIGLVPVTVKVVNL